MQATDGNFYGTTLLGDTGICNGGCGVIFKMTSAGQFTVLHNFTNTDGNHPYGPIIQASDGNLYGTTRYGGSNGYGVVYKITPAGVYKVLLNFKAFGAGSNPVAGLIQATDGKFYGAALEVLYQITSAGNYTTLLHLHAHYGHFSRCFPVPEHQWNPIQ